MHEFSIALSIKEIVYQNIESYLAQAQFKVSLVRVRYGLLSQVVPDILQEAFKSLVQEDDILKNARLELEKVAILLKCTACKQEFTLINKDHIFLPCPHCSFCGSHTLLEGKELVVDHIEAEEV